MSERLRRLGEVFQHAPIYFVTACTHGRVRILNDDDVHRRFVTFARTGEAHGACVGAYVLMPDHLHVLVAIDDQRLSLSTWMKSLRNTFSHLFRRNGIPAPHWQKGFFDHVLRSGDSYSAKWHYVRDNPVRAGLVEDWSSWPYLGEVFPLEFLAERG
jgi:putative transposase